MSDTKLTTITVDGFSVETTDAGAQAISKLTLDLAEAKKVAKAEVIKTGMQLASKDAELATKDAEIDKLKARVLDTGAIDALVQERADLIAVARNVADKDYTGMSADDIRKTAVIASIGNDAISGKSNDYIAARFDMLVDDADQDPVRSVLKTTSHKTKDSGAEAAHAQMVSDATNAWQNAGAKA